MAEATFDALSATRRLATAGFAPGQAEAIVQTVIEANTLNVHIAEDLAALKSHVEQNVVTKAFLAETLERFATKEDVRGMVLKEDIRDMVVKDDIRDMVVKDDIRDMVVKDDIRGLVTEEKLEATIAVLRADLYRALWAQGLGLGTLILGLAVLVATVAVF